MINRVHFGIMTILLSTMAVFAGTRQIAASPLYSDTNLKVVNSIVIDTVLSQYNHATHTYKVVWRVDTIPPDSSILQYGFRFSLNPGTTFKTLAPTVWDTITKSLNQTFIPIDSNLIVFDSSFTIGLWLRAKKSAVAGKASPPLLNSTRSFQVGPFNWQLIAIPKTLTPVYAANGRISIQSVIPLPSVFKDTLWSVKKDTAFLHGFKTVPTEWFEFATKNPPIYPITIELKHGLKATDSLRKRLGLYLVDKDGLHIRYKSYLRDSIIGDVFGSSELSFPIAVVADTQNPVIEWQKIGPPTLEDTLVGISDTTKIEHRFHLKDNVRNLKWKFLFGPGNDAFRDSLNDTLYSTSDSSFSVYMTGKNQTYNPICGVRSYFIATDGVNPETLDVSRSIRTLDTVERYPLQMERWVPIRPIVCLDSTSIRYLFSRSTGLPNWNYDKMQARIFKYKGQSPATPWMEYSADSAGEFSLVPGSLLWCKVATTQTLLFGSGVSNSLKRSTTITLLPKRWTDFTNPYNFDISLADIFNATGVKKAKNLDFYYWRLGEKRYEAVPLYLGKIDTFPADTAHLNYQIMHNAYTVYNSTLDTIVLEIPPICTAGSFFSRNQTKTDALNQTNDKWHVTIKWRVKGDVDYPYFRSIICGYNSELSERNWGPLPPSMSRIFLGFSDSTNSRLYGYTLFGNDISKVGVFPVGLENQTNQTTTIEYYFEPSTSFPKGLGIYYVNPETGLFEQAAQNLIALSTVQPGQRSVTSMAIGTEEAIQQLNDKMIFNSYGIQSIRVHPQSRVFQVAYSLPMGMDQIKFFIYDIRGKNIYESKEKIDGGIRFQKRYFPLVLGQSGATFPSGIYLFRICATGSNTKSVYDVHRNFIISK